MSVFVLCLMGTGQVQAATPIDHCREVLGQLVKEYKRFGQGYFKELQIDPASVPKDDFDIRLLSNLSDNVVRARCSQLNPTYIKSLKAEQIGEKQRKLLLDKLKQTALSDSQNRNELEVKVAATKDGVEQARKTILILSLQANSSLREAMQTVPADKRVVKTVTAAPKLPGVYGGSSTDRAKMNASEKINLSPVDPEFYNTQVGKKLQSDLGGKAQYWSYDFSSDELYVKVGDELGKLRVRSDSDGVRFIQTRIGDSYIEPVGSDTKVDLTQAQGRFLTGDPNQETLFGKMPKASGPSVLDESTGAPVPAKEQH